MVRKVLGWKNKSCKMTGNAHFSLDVCTMSSFCIICMFSSYKKNVSNGSLFKKMRQKEGGGTLDMAIRLNTLLT